MWAIIFSADDRRALTHDRYHHPDPRVQRKMEVLWLKSHGLGHDAIAAYADVSRRTVQRYLEEYLEGGLSRLRCCRGHQPQSALVEHRESLEEYFLEHPPRSARQAQAVIAQQTGVRRGLTQVRHFLKGQLGLRRRKTGAIPVPPKKTVEEHARDQAVFLREKLEPRLKQARRGRRQVYFVDAAHFVFAPFLGFLVVRGAAVRAGGLGPQALQRPGGAGRGDAPVDPGHESRLHQRRVGLRPVAGGLGGRCGVADHPGNGRRGYQKCAVVQALTESLKIELLYLPGYSPNLNLIERLWRFLRKESLDSMYYEDFSRFTAAIDRCLDDLPTAHKGEMETLLTHEFQTFGDVPLLAA